VTLDFDATRVSSVHGGVHAEAGSAQARRSPIRNAFVGPNGIRAGWRLILFIVVFLTIVNTIGFGLSRIPGVHAWRQSESKDVLTAAGQIYRYSIFVSAVLLAALLMAKIEKRSFAQYYLPPGQAFGKRFWQGVPYGFALISLLLGLIAVFHGFSLGNRALSTTDAVKYGLLYGVGFILVGVFEEFSFRGYMQSTLGSSIGFWPAAILLSILFGALHLQNLGEAWNGALMACSLGLLAAFALKRTGNIWFPVGMHAAWDWGQTYFYSTVDSGFVAKDHLLNSSFRGPSWITGGAIGPEGSALVLGVLILGAVGIHFLFPAKQNLPGV
jgi:uncharacterized protein